MNEPDHYRILGVSPQAPRSEIQAAYRARLRQTHPDRGGDEAAFHQVQTAWETLADPARRREYDLLRFGRRAARRYGKAAARPAHRKVRSWNVGPTGAGPRPAPGADSTSALVAVPWHARLRRRRAVASRPSTWLEAALLAAHLTAWAAAGLAFIASAMTSGAPLPIRALAFPAALAGIGMVAATAARTRHRPQTGPPPVPRTRIAVAAAATVISLWAAGPASPLGWQLAVFAAATVLAAWPMRRIRWAAALRRTVGAALRQYNAFGPAGSRPTADRRTGRLLREVLTNLPAARLFVALPAGDRTRVPHAVICGDRLALLCPPVGRDADDVDAESLAAAVEDLTAGLPTAHVRGWILWPTLPESGPADLDGAIDHAPVDSAAADIGPWLAAGGAHYDLPLLAALRQRLSAVPAPRETGDRTPVVRA